MIQKILLLTLIFLYSSTIFPQETIEKIQITKKKQRIKKIKMKAKFAGYTSLSKDDFIVTYFENLPKGKVISATFYFNIWVPYLRKSDNKNYEYKYKDVDFGILVFEKKKDGTLGTLISDSEVKFTVKSNHRGEFKIDVSSIDFPSNNFFLGFKALSDVKYYDSFYNVLLCYSDLNFSYISEKKENEQFIRMHESGNALKTILEIEQ
ncbi:hypothetical protein [Flavobacterium sp. I3-2]|uniref:hypothetical protein n=1 Tax=Flavobacterium sp. I3-2 TaxID=2748319 RepID=UPI0015AD3913|nr:hypothetical protein [Flavobacterium sp. I3-2]